MFVLCYVVCCGCFIDGGEVVLIVFELMCLWYSVYVFGVIDYLCVMWVVCICLFDFDIDFSVLDVLCWLGFVVKCYVLFDDWYVEVEFVVCYKVGGCVYWLYEMSCFECDEYGFWCYVDGEVSEC